MSMSFVFNSRYLVSAVLSYFVSIRDYVQLSSSHAAFVQSVESSGPRPAASREYLANVDHKVFWHFSIINREEGKAQQYEFKFFFNLFTGAAIRWAQHLTSWKKMKRWEVSVCKKAPADVRLAMKSEYEKQATDAEERRRSTEAAIAAVKPSGKRARMTDYLEGDAAAEKHEALRSLALMFAGCHIMEQIVDYPLFVNAIKDVARAGHGYVSRGQKYTGDGALRPVERVGCGRGRWLLRGLTHCEISHNYLTGRALKPLAARTLDLSSNFLSGPLPNGACQPLSFDANCFTLPLGSALVPQRQEAACNAFCGVSSVAGGAAACGGHGVCYPQGPSLAPTCLCDAGFVRSRDIGCVAQGQNRSYSSSQLILPPASALTKGTQRETRGSFTAAPVTLFVYEAGQALSGCGLQLAFHANFSFSLFPQSGRVGFNGFAFVVSATDRVGRGTGVGYGGMDKRSEKPQKAVLERRLALCEVLQGGAEQHTFFFGFVACTTVKPFQKHVILESTVDTFTRTPAYGLQLLTNTYMPAWASPFPRYVSADYRVAPSKQDSWVVSDFHSWDSVPFLGWPVKDQKDCNACWAFALVASVEAAYGIATNGEAPQLSVESLFAAMGLTSKVDKCSTGGSPNEALETLLTLPNGGITEAGAPVSSVVQEQKTFKYQDPCCYTGRLNHVVLVVSYFVFRNDGSQNRIAPPFWIIRNSWGVEWGDRGHMRMDIQGGDGVCGINVLPGIYPIVKMDVCGSDLKSPCYVGTCINDGKGSYSCICPPNYVESTIIDSFPTCDPGLMCYTLSPAVLYTLTMSFVICFELSKAVFISDTCWSISTQLGLTNSNLTALNPGLDCFEPIKASRSLCVERNATFAFTVPQCSQYGMLTPQDTCERLLRQVAGSEGDPTGAGEVNAMRWAELYRNNSGLICSDVIPITASAVGSNTGVQVSGGG
ncbi:unnamed protein product [Closterium sp. NIES-64]|nr:unnamed protein product [Closterium sp. NIES-64]